MNTDINNKQHADYNEYYTEFYEKYYTRLLGNDGLTTPQVNAAIEAFEKALDILFKGQEEGRGFNLKGFTKNSGCIEDFDLSIEKHIVDGQVQYWGIFTGEDDKELYLQGWERTEAEKKELGNFQPRR